MTNKIIDGVFSLSTLNPDLKVFDIIMKTDYGTSYNSYLLMGTEKNVLIDTTHFDFEEEFFKELEKICPIEKIDYLVVNHCEPDHSGSIKNLILKNRNIEIFCTPASVSFLKNITNLNDLKIHIVKDGEILNLGGKTLKFIVAPFLHWPDSMFTYLEEDGIIFSCDFFGTHYCANEIFDTKINDIKVYEKEFKNYYDSIFAPFEQFARNGLQKIKDLNYGIIAPSHGPILTKDGQLDLCLKKYIQWSTKKEKMDYIPVFYCSAYGNTEKIAKQIADGFECKYKLFNVIEHDISELLEILNKSTLFCIGSPTINKNTLPPILNLIAGIDCINTRDKRALVFGSFGWSGESSGIITKLLESMGVKCFAHDLRTCFGPTDEDLKKAKSIGKDFSLLLEK